MKRFFLLCTFLSVSIFGSKAEEYSGFWAVKAGVNFANFTNTDFSSDCQTGFNIGALRAFSLSSKIPIYIQSGLAFEMKGAKNSYSVDGFGVKSYVKSYAVELPVLINYGIKLSERSTIHPFVGVYYSFVVSGKLKEGSNSIDPYKKEEWSFSDSDSSVNTRLFDRSDFGIRFGLDYKYTKYSIGLAYDAGLTNIYAKKFRERNYEASTGSVSINLGYYFK